MTNSPNTQLPEELTLKDLILMLWDGRKIVVAVTFTFMVLTFIVAVAMKPTYQSVSKLITKTANSNQNSQLLGMAALAGINLAQSNTNNPAMYLPDIIKDADFASKFIERKWWYRGDSLFLDRIWKMKIDTTKPDWHYVARKQKLDNLRFGKYISLSEDKKTGLLTLTTEFDDPRLAYDVNIFALSLIDDYIKTNTKSQAKENRIFIEQRIEEIKGELETSENNLASFKLSNVGSNSPRVILGEQRLMRTVALNQELYVQMKKQYELARIEEKKDQPLIEMINMPELPISKERPRKKLMLILGTFIGVFAGVFSSVVVRWWKQNF